MIVFEHCYFCVLFCRGDETTITLGISGISGVSDIIAEIIAGGDDSDVRQMGVSAQQQKAARKKMEQR